MPFEIVRNDITKLKVDAIVNPVNPFPIVGSGTDESINKTAGPELIKAREEFGVIPVGTAVITPGFQLRAKYVIHVANPVWVDGMHDEETLLRKSYHSAFEQASSHKCKSIAFPLLSAGSYRFPKDKALQIAIEAFSKFLMMHDMTVYLVVYNSEVFELSARLFDDIPDYLTQEISHCTPHEDDNYFPKNNSEWEDLFREKKLDFSTLLLRKIDERGKTDPEVYRGAMITRQVFNKIKNGKNYVPKKDTIISLAMSLQMNIEETKELLQYAGYALNSHDPRDMVIEKCIEKKKYSIIKLTILLDGLGLDTIDPKRSK